MAGYRPKRTLYRLTFEDPDFEGLEVTVRSASLDTLMQLLGFSGELDGLSDEQAKGGALLGQVTAMLRLFARLLHSWNVEDDDGLPVPATFEGLFSQDFGFVMPVIERAAAAMTQAPPPLPAGSPSGGISPEALIPMTPAAPSPGPPSSPALG